MESHSNIIEEPQNLIVLGVILFALSFTWEKEDKIGKYTVLIISLMMIVIGVLIVIIK